MRSASRVDSLCLLGEIVLVIVSLVAASIVLGACMVHDVYVVLCVDRLPTRVRIVLGTIGHLAQDLLIFQCEEVGLRVEATVRNRLVLLLLDSPHGLNVEIIRLVALPSLLRFE